jgi:O-acetyl-ADP-ribose deacetylase (regulator of RNase III)
VLQLAVDYEARSIAFPAISTGIYGYPVEPAAAIAVSVAQAFLTQSHALEEVIFCCFSRTTLKVYEALLNPT